MEKILVAFAMFLAIAGSALADGDARTAPLFASNEPIEITITAPFKAIMRERSLEEYTQGTLVYHDAESGEDTSLDIGIRTRGRFRHDRKVCPFAPLRLNFRKTKGTLFADSDKLKLVTHCRNRSTKYEQLVLKEHLAYRILNELTDWSFRTRLANVRYIESTTGKEVADTFAVFIEHREQLEKRIGMKRDESASTTVARLEGQHLNMISVYQFLIGNTDFSPLKGPKGEPCCHNFLLMHDADTQIAVPYDFDMAGIVDAPHASPNERFKISSVRQRLYRGRCVNNVYLDETFALFRERRAAIYATVTTLEGLRPDSRKKTVRYLDDFYKLIDSPKQVQRRIINNCLKT
ncbi:MAG: hypothetical protein KJO56_13595 [Gammaproteobacteria bacterium]|nr:hypothetical protein [Gammaproteobacteria bacterium]NNF50031.1 hypothetical protein [Woeseiaceae bacterium]NNL63167.1 hypothetical protein [Woeseiaceae bacterium]